jgi:hypothetical protein
MYIESYSKKVPLANTGIGALQVNYAVNFQSSISLCADTKAALLQNSTLHVKVCSGLS